MFEQLMTLVFLAPSPPGTWSPGDQPVNQAAVIRMEVSGRPRPGCEARTLALPPARRGTLQFEDQGVRYVGNESETGQLVLRSAGTRPLTLSGRRTQGGLWSLGTDGRCVGAWKLDQAFNTTRR